VSTNGNVLNGLIEQKLLNLHTAFFAKVLSVNGDDFESRTAKIQPLNMIKATGGNAQKQSVMTVPVLKNVQKFTEKKVTVNGSSFWVTEAYGIEAGDVVLCLCGEREITETKKGNFAVPTAGHHRISDAVVVGVI
jgi:hypothetical protein